uniref:Protein TIC 214 n=1 Tax=Legenere valdiviana TaxID=2010882 RepID=A0A1Z2QUQ4_9ASTR|nr:hypothetical protein Le_val1Pt1085 [Legenere valdiviana]ASA35116.1 hypothetical protein Le_val1Pt1085 [Legenere valdiviana]
MNNLTRFFTNLTRFLTNICTNLTKSVFGVMKICIVVTCKSVFGVMKICIVVTCLYYGGPLIQPGLAWRPDIVLGDLKLPQIKRRSSSEKRYALRKELIELIKRGEDHCAYDYQNGLWRIIRPLDALYQITGEDCWIFLRCPLGIRGLIILQKAFSRKYIWLPLAIIGKNIARILLFQQPEWAEDITDWKNETYWICDEYGFRLRYGKISITNALEILTTNMPQQWWEFGFEVEVSMPVELRPWHIPDEYKRRRRLGAYIKPTWGLTHYPWCPSFPPRYLFWIPIYEVIQEKIQTLVYKVVKEKMQRLEQIVKELHNNFRHLPEIKLKIELVVNNPNLDEKDKNKKKQQIKPSFKK